MSASLGLPFRKLHRFYKLTDFHPKNKLCLFPFTSGLGNPCAQWPELCERGQRK